MWGGDPVNNTKVHIDQNPLYSKSWPKVQEGPQDQKTVHEDYGYPQIVFVCKNGVNHFWKNEK